MCAHAIRLCERRRWLGGVEPVNDGDGPGDGGRQPAPTEAGALLPADGVDSGSAVAPDGGNTTFDAGPVAAGVSSGTLGFHLLLGVSGADTPGDSLSLAGDNYTDLIASNVVAGVMLGHLIRKQTPGMLFDEDYLYGSMFGQLLQENLDTELYSSSSDLIDPSPLQQAVMGTGQGGPYQINNYAVDMVHGSYSPQGNSLINYVALQKNIGYAFADAATQYAKATPASFNDKHYGPMLRPISTSTTTWPCRRSAPWAATRRNGSRRTTTPCSLRHAAPAISSRSC